MNSLLTRPKTLQELYRTYFSFANRFEFTALLRNYIQCEEWKDKSQETVWNMVSRISDDIGAVLTDGIVNYTRNVVDVNTCKVPQLLEHARMLSYGLDHIKNSYAFFPKRIQCLVDLFSINPEYLIGNHQNHILSDGVIKEILVYIRDNTTDRTPFTNDDVIDRLLDDPHGLTDKETYRKFVQLLFFNSIKDALVAQYSTEDRQPMVFNMLWEERQNQQNIISRISEYKSWVDRFISNEIEHPLNEPAPGKEVLPGTIYDTVQTIKNQKKMSAKFNPFKIADHIYFNGFNPNNGLSKDELDLVETVLNYHSRTKYSYQERRFVDDEYSDVDYHPGSTKYSYYKELEWCEYVKMVMFIVNNLRSFNINKNLSYDIISNKFFQMGTDDINCIRVVELFNQNNRNIVENPDGTVALNADILMKVSRFLCDYVFHISGIRENIKTIAQKHAMRGTGALLVHMVNDYLIKELPFVRDTIWESVNESGKDVDRIKFGWETNDHFNHYGNVTVLEYEDDNEYFNIDPDKDIRFTDRTNARYWEKLEGMEYEDSLGVLTKGQIRDFYRNVLGMGRLQPKKPKDYDDVCDFLVDLFKIGANPISYENGELKNPIDDIFNKSEEDYGYTKEERLDVQTNTQLRTNQEKQFLEFCGSEELIGDEMYDLIGNRIFYWKNRDYSSHMLHPFMYNLKIWNKLNNIIINGYKDYINSELIDILSSKVKFDQVFGEYGEGRNFWRYNIMDWTGYTTRYEASVKDEHTDDEYRATSKLTGYDGLFYPETALEFLDMFNSTPDRSHPLWENFFVQPKVDKYGHIDCPSNPDQFVKAIYSIYWQLTYIDGDVWRGSFYERWYSHLNYTRKDYQKIAIQLWYWKDRIVDMIRSEYPITRYCLDPQGNSLIMVSPFKEEECETNPYLIDLTIAQDKVENPKSDFGNGNNNIYVPFCDNKLKKPSELWIRWKSNPIAIPSLDVDYDQKTGDVQFDLYYRTNEQVEMGQLTHTNNETNEKFKLVINEWRNAYGDLLPEGGMHNQLPVFFDMQQSANVIALASWNLVHTGEEDENGEIVIVNTAKNPLHIISIERNGTSIYDYCFTEYGNIDAKRDWLFDAYHYCPANGSILIPFYTFECNDTVTTESRGGDDARFVKCGIDDNENFTQKLRLNMFTIPAQQLKGENYVATEMIQKFQEIEIPINGVVRNNDGANYRFDYPAKVCRNTNLVFSVYDSGNLNKVKCAFLGCFDAGQDETSFKVSSCDAKTRYEFDSQTEENLGLLKGKYFKGGDSDWMETDSEHQYWNDNPNIPMSNSENRKYIDQKIASRSFNSYDSMDKYVFVVDFEPSIDSPSLFDRSVQNGKFSTYTYNILGDAGYIPHFAYQSLVKYDDKDGGIAYTWRNEYLRSKEHMQFELLGLDDKNIPTVYDFMNRMVVKDTTDNCDTLINPAKMMQGIFRIWCEERGEKTRYMMSGDSWQAKENNRLDHYFSNEYKDYTNKGELPFGSGGVAEWSPDDNEELFELELPKSYEQTSTSVEMNEQELEQFKRMLDEYYVSILRTEDGEIQNEKRYILPPTSVSAFFLSMGKDDGFIKCRISPFQSSRINDNHFVSTQVVFTGTQNPFNYDVNGERIYSRPEELQYGNSICGVAGLELRIDVVSEIEYIKRFKKIGDKIQYGDDGHALMENTDRILCVHRRLKPTLRFTKFHTDLPYDQQSLNDKVQMNTNSIEPGKFLVILSHRNMDNIAKYHILNRTSNLYFGGSLPKSWQDPSGYLDPYYYDDPSISDKGSRTVYGLNQLKYSNFRSDIEVHLEECTVDGESGLKSRESRIDEETGRPMLVDGHEIPYIEFKLSEIQGDLPPYHVIDSEYNEVWYLSQDHLVPSGAVKPFTNSDGREVTRDIPTKGSFKWAHRVKEVPTSYLDYLYVKNGNLAFKVNEESNFLGDSLTMIPPFYIDEVLKNKLNDLYNVQVMTDYSTFIHESENPQDVVDCGSFKPLFVDAILKHGLLQTEKYEYGKDDAGSASGDPVDDANAQGIYGKPISTEDGKAILLDNCSATQRLALQLEDGEVADYLKIYTNFVRVDDGNGDFHYDIYFNIQNLFNSPFEYISSVTQQPNVLILPKSYLYLTGDKYTDGKIDDEKVRRIKEGGELVIYGQVKTYSNDVLSDVRTIELFRYNVYNISDDKPKFLIQKTYDITKSTLKNNIVNKVKMQFCDVMWNMVEDDFDQENTNLKFKVLKNEIMIVQPLKISYDWKPDDDARVLSISFDVANDIIDFGATPELMGYYAHDKTLVNVKKPYYDRWSDRYMKMKRNQDGTYRFTLTYDEDCGFNFETIYLRWRLPVGFKVMDTIDRLGGYMFSSTARNVVVVPNNTSIPTDLDVITGHVVGRVQERDTMYLGMEHSTKKRMNGYILNSLSEMITNAIKETDIKNKAGNQITD